MKVSEALRARKSIRAFQANPIDRDLVVSVFERAARAPSGGNVQPWKIVILDGERLEQLKDLMQRRLRDEPHPEGEAAEYSVYPSKLKEPYRTARFEVGEEMYGLLGIPRDDREKRLQWFANNYRFFGAPAAAFCFVDRVMGAPQWSDLGMFLQSAMLLFQEEGLGTCAQEVWSTHPKTIGDFCEVPEEWMLFCGMAIGIPDDKHPVNQLDTKRLPTDEWLKVL